MKKILLVFAVFFVARLNAQIVNAGFENWAVDTSHLSSPLAGVVPVDSFTYSDPVGWTSANAVTGQTALGNFILVTQSATAHGGLSSVQLTTDTLTSISVSGFTGQLTVPGMVLNGVFPVTAITNNIVSLTTSSVSPGNVPGAGQPFTQLLDSFTGYYQYTPVINTYTGALDTCVMWATLRRGTTIVANAKFKSQTNTGGQWARFSAPFVYLNCETPDTLVILLASSVPTFSGLLSGHTNLTRGSVLLVDDLAYDTLVANTNFVFAQNDIDSVHRGDADTINVLANDTSCNGSALTVSITIPPANGNAAVLSNNKIVYTGNTNFTGRDSLLYTDTDPNNVTSSAWLKLIVNFGTGISEANHVAVKMFPVPASDQLHLQFQNKGHTTARIYDVVGNLVSVEVLTQNDNIINVNNFTNGVYCIQLLDEMNTVIARTKFVVNK